jgi:hypothetical protein
MNRGTVALIATSLVTLAASTWFGVIYLSTPDTCALPPNVASLDAQAQLALTRHAMACRDLEAGRITLTEYRALIGAELPAAPPPTVTVQWASSVRAVSSEYSTTDWSAKQALGAPDVYPRSGDDPHAWASRDADAPFEFIEVGFASPQRIHGLQVFETLAPGAITEVEIITASGKRKIIYEQPRVDAATVGSQISSFDFACSDEPIVAARVTLASGQVPGWNEIDAIGALPCR